MPPSASFDVLGTCFHFTPVIDRIQEILDRIASSSGTSNSTKTSASTLTASSLFHTWFYSSQRDFTYLSIQDTYIPIISIFKATFRRAAYVVGVPDALTVITDEDVQGLMEIMGKLPAREGLKDCFDALRGAGWDVLAVTNGGRAGTRKYYGLADLNVEDDDGKGEVGLISCDDVPRGGEADGKGVAKPDARVYAYTNKVLDQRGENRKGKDGATTKTTTATSDDNGSGDRWFVAAHSWDLIAARKAGFRTAWIAHEEGDTCKGLFGDFDVYARDFKECAELILKTYTEKK